MSEMMLTHENPMKLTIITMHGGQEINGIKL